MINPKQAREYLGLNQTQMAQAMGIHRNTWVQWERGERSMAAASERLISVLIWLQGRGLLEKFLSTHSESQ